MIDPLKSDIDGLIIDMDGTMIDSRIDFKRMGSTIIEIGINAGIPDTKIGNHHSLDENILTTLDHSDRSLAQEIETAMLDIEREALDRVEAFDGVGESLSMARSNGVRIGVLTRASRTYAIEALRLSGLERSYDAIVCRDDWAPDEAKPNPLAARRVAEQMRVPIHRCAMIGDHLLDRDCALAVGIPFVGVLTGSTSIEGWEDDHMVVDALPSAILRMLGLN